MNVLLVTGSRSLCAAALNASREILRELMSCEREVSLVVGDARGPDAVALGVAMDLRKPSAVFCLDGDIRASIFKKDKWWINEVQDWWKPTDPRPPSHRWPLERNKAMVRYVAGLRGAIETLAPDNWTGPGYETRLLCVGFVDPASTTRGTDHTLRLARQAGIWCARYVWQGAGFEEQS